jgi:aldose 1-epimerase
MGINMAITTSVFGTTKDNKEAHLYTISNNNGVTARVTDFGAILVNLLIPDKNGNTADVVLGYDTLEGYFTNNDFFGATIGPSANRIDNASFEINGTKYQLAANDGTNNLHSDKDNGYHKRLWSAELVQKENKVVFSLEDEDGAMGFPGNKKVSVSYSLSEDNSLSIHYKADSDKDTLFNMTNHTYFNLAGHASGNIENHILQINAAKYTPVYKRLIPTGEFAAVEGTPFDFRTPKRVGEDINADNEQLKFGQGYDHNFVIDGYTGGIIKIASVDEPVSGRKMEVFSDRPAVQFYAGNCVAPQKGKDNASYGKRSGLCLETQAIPNSINQKGFNNVVYGPQRQYDTTTIYKF